MIDLTDKQRAFCEEYIMDWNGAQAAIRAGYSKKTAKEQASRLLTNVNVQDYLKECKAKTAELAGLSKMRITRSLMDIAFSDDEAITTTSRIRANEVLVKMYGWNEPDLIETTNSTGRKSGFSWTESPEL